MNPLTIPVAAICQCEFCLRYFRRSADGVAFELATGLRPQEIGLPELFVCGSSDCAAIAAELARRENASVRRAQRAVFARRQAIREATSKVQGPRSKVQSRRGGDHRPAAPVDFERGCPRDTEPLTDESTVHSPQSTVGSSQEEFLAAVDVGPAHQRLLQHFQERYGQWCPLPELEKVCGHHAVNSRCSELRQFLPADHDIDQMNLPHAATGRVHSHYRLCLKSESVRLKRIAEREGNEGQGELATE